MLLVRCQFSRIAGAIEHAALPGDIRGRNRYLLWKLPGAELHPPYEQSWAAVAYTSRRARSRLSSDQRSTEWRKRGHLPCRPHAIGWKCRGLSFLTPHGALAVGTDSVAAVRAVARRSWYLAQQRADLSVDISLVAAYSVWSALAAGKHQFAATAAQADQKCPMMPQRLLVGSAWRARTSSTPAEAST